MEEEVPSTSSSSSNLQIVEVNPEEGIKIKEEDMQIKTEIEVPKKPTATIALPFSPFSAGMKPKPNQTIKIYHIPAANGIGSTKPPIIKAIKLERASKLNIIKKQNKEIQPKPSPIEVSSENMPKPAPVPVPNVLLKPQLKEVMKSKALTPAKKKKELKLMDQFIEQEQRPPPSIKADKYCWYKHDRAVLARDKTVTFVLSTEKLNGTFAVGVVHDSPEYQHIKITQLLKRGSSGEHPRKKDFSRSEDPVFEVWTDRIKKEDVSYTDVQVGKYGPIKMAILHLAYENQMYFKFSTESTALFLEAIAHLWNLVYLQLTDAGGDYKADYLEIDKMEARKLPIQIVAVIRRNKPTKDYRVQSVENTGLKGYLINKIIEELKEMEETELKEVYSSILSRKVKVEK